MRGGQEPFSQRIVRRQRLWWGRPGWRDALHRLRERSARHSRHDPDEAWRCCQFWPRVVCNKRNGREFAAKHGLAVPQLYWSGKDPAQAPLGSLPSHFVVRPIYGGARRGVLVVATGLDLLRQQPFSRTSLPQLGGKWQTTPFLIEEFVRSEDGRYELPLECKCHVFSDTVAAVQVVERTGVKSGAQRYYTAEWEPFPDPMDLRLPQADVREPPRCFEQMLALAKKFGAEFGTYMRLDFFATDQGCVYNEFGSVPNLGLDFTPYCDEVFGAVWAERIPDGT
jgi:hypothetical protein